MITVTKSVIETREFAARFRQEWETNKKEVKIRGKSLHTLLKLKKQVDEQDQLINETLLNLALQNNGETQPDGSINIIDKEDQKRANEQMNDYSKEQISFLSEPIALREEQDIIPLPLYEVIFDFIEYEE